jgi:orotate phosphoribosyltransferase
VSGRLHREGRGGRAWRARGGSVEQCLSFAPRGADAAADAADPLSRVRGRMSARDRLIDELRAHALVLGEVVLTSGRTAQYYVDAKRAVLRPAGFRALAELVAERARAWGATAVGGLTMGADAPACAALAGGADVKAFFIRKDVKQHGLQRRIEGPLLEPRDRCLIVEDVVTTGGSTLQAIEAVRDAGHEIVGVVAILDRLAGGGEAIRAAVPAPYEPLATIDDVYPDRPDRPDRPG